MDMSTRLHRLDIELLTSRLISVTDWIIKQETTQNTLLGYFGDGTGAVIALIAADRKPEYISAIVSSNGMVDLSLKYTSLKSINCPTLFIVGGKDEQVIKGNQQILENYLEKVEKKKMIIIPGVNYLFKEQSKIDELAKKTSGWFRCYFQIKEHETIRQKEK
jgi:putative phosphoribosyl transferase